MTRALSHVGQVDDLRLLLAAGLVGSAVVHAAVVPAHLTAWSAAGEVFVVLTAAELALAGLVLVRPGRLVLLATVGASVGALALWLFPGAVRLPFGPESGVAVHVGLADSVAALLALGTLLAGILLLRAGTRPSRLFASPHASRLVLVAIVAVTALGLGGSGLGWVDLSGSGVAVGQASRV